MKFIGNIIALILWGFFIALGFWIWNQIADRWANPKLDAYMERKVLEKEAKPAKVQA